MNINPVCSLCSFDYILTKAIHELSYGDILTLVDEVYKLLRLLSIPSALDIPNDAVNRFYTSNPRCVNYRRFRRALGGSLLC